MVPPAAAVATTMFRVRFYSSSLQRRMARLQRLSRQRSSASKSNLRRCKEEWFRLQTVVAKPELHRFLISGPNLRIDARISPFTPSCVQRFLISGRNLGIDAGFSPFTPSFMHRFLISGPDLGIDAGNRWHCSNEVRVRF